jgi:holo-[acyl-carrier protein] synthase
VICVPPQDSITAVSEDGRLPLDGGPLAARAVRLLSDALGPAAPPLRLGIDVCDVGALRRQLHLPSANQFLSNSFTRRELDYCAGRPERIAARWAAKEAVAKAIGTGFRGLRPNQIEIRRRRTGEPYVQPADSRPWPHDAHTWSWLVSLSHEAELAVAVAIAISANTTTTALAPADTKGSQL